MAKTLKNLLLQNQKSYDLETWHVASGLKLYIVYINDDPGLTLTYFNGKVKFGNLGFYIGKSENSGFFRNYCSL